VSDVQFKQGRRGDMFVRQGEPADAFFIIERGSFEVVLEVSPGAERTLARLKKGEFFGEVGLVHGAPRMATVRVASNCDEAQTLVVSKEAFLRLVEPASRTRERVFRTLAQRMAANRG
jgi:cAMP-dependent protein kinase regulator